MKFKSDKQRKAVMANLNGNDNSNSNSHNNNDHSIKILDPVEKNMMLLNKKKDSYGQVSLFGFHDKFSNNISKVRSLIQNLEFTTHDGVRIAKIDDLRVLKIKNGIAQVEDGSTGSGHSIHPNIDSSGSVSGMRKYWGDKAQIQRAFGQIYNVSSVVMDKENIWDVIALYFDQHKGEHELEFLKNKGLI